MGMRAMTREGAESEARWLSSRRRDVTYFVAVSLGKVRMCGWRAVSAREYLRAEVAPAVSAFRNGRQVYGQVETVPGSYVELTPPEGGGE